MLIDEERYCDLCHGVIVLGQKHVQIRSAGSPGQSRFDCRHYHYRFEGDCWDRQHRNQNSHRGSETQRTQIPNTKIQIPNKLPIHNPNSQTSPV